jgi:hypothetical protein
VGVFMFLFFFSRKKTAIIFTVPLCVNLCLPRTEIVECKELIYYTHSLPKPTMVDLSVYVLICQRRL